jgi:hypothetical protein
MIAYLPNLDEILKRHEIPEKFWPEMHRLVEDGVRPCPTLVTRLNRVRNYKAALHEIMTDLSKPLGHKFPPADYQSPVSYESLRSDDIESEDSVLLTSATAPCNQQQPTHDRPMTARRLHAILKRHEIHPKFWPEFRAMVELGQSPSKELWTRMNHVANFRAARNEIATELSKGLDHEFPPDDYEVPEGYDFDMPARRKSQHKSLTPKTSRRKPAKSTRVCRQSP